MMRFLTTWLLALVGFVAFAGDAAAFGKKKKAVTTVECVPVQVPACYGASAVYGHPVGYQSGYGGSAGYPWGYGQGGYYPTGYNSGTVYNNPYPYPYSSYPATGGLFGGMGGMFFGR